MHQPRGEYNFHSVNILGFIHSGNTYTTDVVCLPIRPNTDHLSITNVFLSVVFCFTIGLSHTEHGYVTYALAFRESYHRLLTAAACMCSGGILFYGAKMIGSFAAYFDPWIFGFKSE